MPREITIPIVNYPDRTPGRAYRLRVCALTRPRKQTHLLALLEHLDAEQAGRPLEIQLSLPCYPTGLTAQFIAACGHAIMIGTSVRVKDCLGKTVLARFHRTESGDLEVSSFEAIIPEDLYATPEPTGTHPAAAPTPQADPDRHHGR